MSPPSGHPHKYEWASPDSRGIRKAEKEMEHLLNSPNEASERLAGSGLLAELDSVTETGAVSPAFYLSAGSITTPSPADAEATSPTSPGQLDEFALNQSYQTFREDLRGLIFHAAQSTAPTREGSPAVPTNEDELFHGNRPDADLRRRETAAILHAGNRSVYLKNYLSSVAPWLDMFDSDRAFGLRIPLLARTSPALLYAILGTSARQMERKEGRRNQFESLELYQEAIRLLAPLLLNRDHIVIPTCVMLCVLEMLSARAQEWRRHLEGCASLFGNFGVHGFSGEVLQGVFWCYARMDLCGALISDGTQSTLVPPITWLPPDVPPSGARELFLSSQSPDMYANYAVWLCARACELVHRRTLHLELGEQNDCAGDEFYHSWVDLWDEMQMWLRDLPPEFQAVGTVDTKPFPQMLFPHWAAISSVQLHHTACLLLLGVKPKPSVRELLGVQGGSVVWHAKQICGISLANAHHGCLNNALQPLWLAGRVLSHRSEHDVIVKLVMSIETLTGWGTCWRIADLESTWGYKVRRSR